MGGEFLAVKIQKNSTLPLIRGPRLRRREVSLLEIFLIRPTGTKVVDWGW